MNLFKQQWLIIVSFLMAVLFLAACGGGGAAQATSAPSVPTSAPQTAAPQAAAPTKASAPEPTATTLAPTTEPPTATPPAPTQPAVWTGTKIDMNNPIFKAYFAAYNKFPRRAQATVIDAKTQVTSTVLIETDARDHLRIDVSGLHGTKDITTSMVIISPTMYLKEGSNWLKLPGAQAGTLLGLLNDTDSLQQLLNAFDELVNYTVTPLGPEDVNGTSAMAYASEFVLKDGKSSTGKAWIGNDGLLLKDTIETSGGITVTTTYDFDPSIKVEAPIP